MARVVAPIAIAAASLVTVWCVFLRDPRPVLVIAAANAPRRPIEGRLSGFEHGERPQLVRSGDRSMEPSRFYLRRKAFEILGEVGQSTEPSDLHNSGVAALLTDDPSYAIEKLTAATQHAPDEARFWNDLAVALYTQFQAGGKDPLLLPRALSAADQAVRIELAMREALFNRALILDAMGLRLQTIRAWERYLEVDPSSPWSVETRSRLDGLARVNPADDRQRAIRVIETAAVSGVGEALRDAITRYPEEARRRGEAPLLATWAAAEIAGDDDASRARLAVVRTIGKLLHEQRNEPLLAETVAVIDACGSPDCRKRLAFACRAYDLARRLFGDQRLTDALPALRSASIALHEAKLPLALVADYYVIGVLEDSGDVSPAAALDRLQKVVPPRYLALHAQLLWQRGTAHTRAGETVEALDAYLAALALFDRLGEMHNAARMRNDAAAVCALLGRDAEAWRLRLRAFEALSDVGDARAIQNSVTSAARVEAVAGNWLSAVSLLNLAADPELLISQRLHVDALMWRALASHKLGQSTQGLADLRNAQKLTDLLPDQTTRAIAKDDLSFVEAALLRETRPATAAAMLDGYLRNAIRRDRNFFRAEAHLERGRCARLLQDPVGAEQHLRAALRTLEKRHASSRSDAEIYFRTGEVAAYELTDLLMQRGDAESAWQVIDTTRATGFDAVTAETPVNVPELTRRLAPDVLILEYVALDGVLLIFSIDRSGLLTYRVPVARAELAKRQHELLTAIRDGADAEAEHRAYTFFSQLLAPVERLVYARHLIIVPDRVLDGIPFAMLRADARSDHLLTRTVISLTPSVTLLYRFAHPHIGAQSSVTGTLFVGDPAIDGSRFPELPRLDAAGREARNLARLYDQRQILVGPDATPSRVASAMEKSLLVHLATHAIVNESDPLQSFLVLAPDADGSSVLYSHNIAALNLSRARVVVLAGCRTAAAAEVNSNVGSLALAFLHARAPAVIGALWSVDDREAEDFSRRFHKRLAQGRTPADALREAQIELMRTTSSSRSWAGYIVMRSQSSSEIDSSSVAQEGL